MSLILLFFLCLVSPALATDYSVTVLASFTAANSFPNGQLAIDSSGNLYGTSIYGGVLDQGSIFKYSASNHSVTTLASFDITKNGANPRSGLTFNSSASALYGTTSCNYGCVYQLSLQNNNLTTLYSFNFYTGDGPLSEPVLDSTGCLIGTCPGGGQYGGGIVFRLNPITRTYSVLASFNWGTNYSFPWSAVILDSSGNIYGTTGGSYEGMDYGMSGSLFELVPGSQIPITLITNLSSPNCDLIMDSSGNIYGAAGGTLFQFSTVSHDYKTLALFSTSLDGPPKGNLVMDGSGNIYGTARNSVFEFNVITHTLVPLAFLGVAGSSSMGGLCMDTAGNLYGTTTSGGDYGYGTVFMVSPTPEPSAFLILIIGTFCLKRRRRSP
jgi:uncharacterized repeat protein (TIGR03803 family)